MNKRNLALISKYFSISFGISLGVLAAVALVSTIAATFKSGDVLTADALNNLVSLTDGSINLSSSPANLEAGGAINLTTESDTNIMMTLGGFNNDTSVNDLAMQAPKNNLRIGGGRIKIEAAKSKFILGQNFGGIHTYLEGAKITLFGYSNSGASHGAAIIHGRSTFYGLGTQNYCDILSSSGNFSFETLVSTGTTTTDSANAGGSDKITIVCDWRLGIKVENNTSKDVYLNYHIMY